MGSCPHSAGSVILRRSRGASAPLHKQAHQFQEESITDPDCVFHPYMHLINASPLTGGHWDIAPLPQEALPQKHDE